jgi:hypothetical protein
MAGLFEEGQDPRAQARRNESAAQDKTGQGTPVPDSKDELLD